MSYQVLARKWRPRSFPEMVGQEHVLRALINALDHDRLHHAFLFTGTRGVGKTTVARILAKSINCEQGVSSSPCGVCGSCQAIDEGRFVDLIEVDAASRTKVEDTRELLENVQYAPARGRYKVYLIDEVHMLSNHSFNALLKTLEEPPPHVKFLLATTDPQRLPVTILSRCLQFNLKRLPLELIRGHLAGILEQEGIPAEPAALAEIARAADGSMRDALSLLDQAIAYTGGRLAVAEVRDMLGSIDRQRIYALLDALAAGDGRGLLAQVRALEEHAPDYLGVLQALTSALHQVALAQAVPESLDEDLGEAKTLRALAASLSPEDIQLYYQIGVTGRRDLPLAPDPRSGFEMVLLRMLAFRPAQAGETPLPSAGAGSRRGARAVKEARPDFRRGAEATSPPPSPAVAEATTASPAPAEAVKPQRNDTPAETADTDWTTLVQALPLAGMVRQFAIHCALAGREGDAFDLVLDPAHRHLLNPKREVALREALEEYLGRPVRLTVGVGEGETPAKLEERHQAQRQQAAEQAIADDPNAHSILERFNGHIEPGSVRPAG